MARLPALAVYLLALLLVACGEDASEPQRSAGSWSSQRLDGEVGDDWTSSLVTADNDAVVLLVSGKGSVQPHLSRDGGPFVAGEVLDAGLGLAGQLAGPVRLTGGSWLALGSTRAHAVLALRSDDGLRWTATPASGFDGPVDVSALVATPRGAAAVGARRRAADPDMGGFQAAAWTTTDGVTYAERALPDVPVSRGYASESVASDLVAVGDDALLAAGAVRQEARAWRSTDGGATWTAVTAPLLDQATSVSALAADGERVVAAASGLDHETITSSDGGHTWHASSALAVNEEAGDWSPLWQVGRWTFTLRDSAADGVNWSSPEVCYADIAQCGRQPAARLVATVDGLRWRAIDGPPTTWLDVVAGTADGRVLVLRRDREGVVVDTWPADVPLRDAPADPTPTRVELVTLADGASPVVGVRYAHSLFTHCGISRIWFGDEPWRRTDDGPDYETGAGDPVIDGWPIPEKGGNVYGYATLGEDGVLTYSDEDGTVLATYVRAEEGFGCD